MTDGRLNKKRTLTTRLAAAAPAASPRHAGYLTVGPAEAPAAATSHHQCLHVTVRSPFCRAYFVFHCLVITVMAKADTFPPAYLTSKVT